MSSGRHKAREVAVQMLYQKDLNPDIEPDVVRLQIQELLRDEDMRRFAWSLYAGTVESLTEIDKRIAAVAANWAVSRMPPTDRNAIRLGAFELLYTETPHRVVIDEALELAKTFGTANSTGFVNGILDRLVPPERKLREAASNLKAEPSPVTSADEESESRSDSAT